VVVDAIEASTTLYATPEEVFAFIQDFSGYDTYSDNVDSVKQYGDGGPGTDYRITVSWWKLSYTSHQRVTAVEEPSRIDWRTTDAVRARGSWRIASLDPPAGREVATELRLHIEFDPASMRGGSFTRLLPFDALVDRLSPVIAREAERVLAGMVADLEGARRPVDITVHRVPQSI
jgi:ribosome-associated toxin RatA of RatAB toxin-antitoxin module